MFSSSDKNVAAGDLDSSSRVPNRTRGQGEKGEGSPHYDLMLWKGSGRTGIDGEEANTAALEVDSGQKRSRPWRRPVAAPALPCR
jgi:hypothetical protein